MQSAITVTANSKNFISLSSRHFIDKSGCVFVKIQLSVIVDNIRSYCPFLRYLRKNGLFKTSFNSNKVNYEKAIFPIVCACKSALAGVLSGLRHALIKTLVSKMKINLFIYQD